MEDLSGRTLKGRYALTRVIGRGGMGVVYEAIHLDLGRKVAIKALFGHDERALQRFRQEALASASVHHPNLISISDFHGGDAEDPPFLVMELLQGENLSQLLARTKPLEARTAVLIATQMLEGLSAIHAANIVHRDVKPGNMFLITLPGTGYLVKILDLGIAKLLEDESGVRTTTGHFVGTPAYVAPEQVLAGKIDGRTDVHAVSVVLHEMLEGRRPYQAGQGFEIIQQILKAPPPRITNPQVPPLLADIVQRGLAKDKEQRWPSAAAMRDALRAWLETAAPGPPSALAHATHVDRTQQGLPTRIDAVPPGSSPSVRTAAPSHPHTMPHPASYPHQRAHASGPRLTAHVATPMRSHGAHPPARAKSSLAPLAFLGLGLGVVGLGGLAFAVKHIADDAGTVRAVKDASPYGSPSLPPIPGSITAAPSVTTVASLPVPSSNPPAPGPSPKPLPSPVPAPSSCGTEANARVYPFVLKLKEIGDGFYPPEREVGEAGVAWWNQNEAAIRAACFQRRTCWTDIWWSDAKGSGTCPSHVMPPPGCDSTTEKCLVAYTKAHPPIRASKCKGEAGCYSISFHVATIDTRYPYNGH